MLELANQGVRLWPSGDSFCEMGVANGCSQTAIWSSFIIAILPLVDTFVKIGGNRVSWGWWRRSLTLLTYSELGFRGTFPGSYLRGITIGCIVVQTVISLEGD